MNSESRHLLYAAVLCLLVCLCAVLCSGCMQFGQINNPWSDGQAHWRGTGYNAASEGSAPAGESAEAFQQIRAGTSIEVSSQQDKATDLTGATRQGQATSESAQSINQATSTASGDQTPASTPTDANPVTIDVTPIP